MFESYLLNHLKKLKLSNNFYFFAVLHGLSTLLIPFGVQLLVNNLSLTGLWLSTYSFLIIIALGLGFSLVVKYAQFILIEYLQRHILDKELKEWKIEQDRDKFDSPYFFEMFKQLKSFSLIFSESADLALTLVFGILALVFIHPAFLMISGLFIASLFLIRILGRGAILSSIEESNAKYSLYYSLPERQEQSYRDLALDFFKKRDRHFNYIKRQSIIVFLTSFVLQIILLSWGIHLISVDQLSIGQLVSAEIISSGIFINFVKLPKLIESFYDFETSCYKLDQAKAEAIHEA